MADGQSVMRPLPIYPPDALTDEDRSRIVRAKQKLNTPVLAVFARGVPGSDRVLAIGERPPFACDYAQVEDTRSPGLADAIAFVLGLTDDPRAVTLVEWLSDELGSEVTEIETSEVQENAGTSVPKQLRGDTIGGVELVGPRGAVDPNVELAGPRGAVDPNVYNEGNYRAAIRASAQG